MSLFATRTSPWVRLACLPALAAAVLLAPPATAAAPKPDPAAMLLDAARRAYNEKNYSFAADRFKEFLARHGGHKDAPAARYGLALSLLDGPAKDYDQAIPHLQSLAPDKARPEHPFVLYYLGLSHRGQGVRALREAAAKPGEAKRLQDVARQRFEEAVRDFAGAADAFTSRVKAGSADRPLALEEEWAARARCDQAEMLLRVRKAKDAVAVAAPFLKDGRLKKSRYHGLAVYYHGFGSFLLGERAAAGRSLTQLAPFTDPVFGTHGRYLLARVHHAEKERAEAKHQYEGVLTDHARRKQEAVEALKQPDRFKNDPDEKARLEQLARGAPPDHVGRATFFLGVMLYEDGRFAEALTRLAAFRKDFPKAALIPEVQLREGFCQVQLKQFAEAQKTLQPLADKEPALADQALLWIGKAQEGAAEALTGPAREQGMRAAVETLRRAADKANQQAGSDPGAKKRRGEALLEMADAQQRAGLYKDAAATCRQLLNDKILPARDEEVRQRLVTALHLAGDFDASDAACADFRKAHPKSVLLPAVLFRHAENAYFKALAVAKSAKPEDRVRLQGPLLDESIKRYSELAEKYPEFTYANLARYGLAQAYYHKGDLEKAKQQLGAIPAAERSGDLAAVPYQLADVLIRLAPARADDAVAAGKLEEQLKQAVELLEGFAGADPKGPHAADALLKLGYCHGRLARLQAQPAEKAKALAAARAAYEQLLQRFPKGPEVPQAKFERAKCLAEAKDIGGAVNELRQFTNDPLKKTAVAPMAVLQLATLLREQRNPAEAAKVLDECRKQHENDLARDPTRALWVPLLQYHHGVALREAGKHAEARDLFNQVVQKSPDLPEAWEAGLRGGQSLADEGGRKIAEGNRRMATAGTNAAEREAGRKLIDEGVKEVRDAVAQLLAHSGVLKGKKPATEDRKKLLEETRARLLYEAAWGYRTLAAEEVRQARAKLQHDLWQKRHDELAKKTPAGGRVPHVPLPEVLLKAVPLQPAEKQARDQYAALMKEFPEAAINADVRFELAELLAQRGEHDAAVKLLRSALEDKEPKEELADKIRVRLGVCLMEKGDTKAALEELQPVADNAKSKMAAHAKYRVGECLLLQGDHAGAVKALAVFRDQAPFQNVPGLSDRALLRLGSALAQLKRWDESRQSYEQLVGRFNTSPWAAEARYGIGWAHQSKGNYDQAVSAYGQVTDAVATELGARAQLNIGLCRLAQKRYPEASTALLLVPFTYDYPKLSALALVEAARSFAENKQKDRAMKLLERVLRDHGDTEAAEAARKRLDELKKG